MAAFIISRQKACNKFLIAILIIISFLLPLHIFAQNQLTIDQFLSNPFDFVPNSTTIIDKFHFDFQISKVAVRNKYVTEVKDTIIRMEYKKSLINIYKEGTGEKLNLVDIQNKNIILRNGIQIGMKREALEKQFHWFPKSAKKGITIYSEDQTRRCTFIFKRNKLNRVRYEALIQ